MPVWGRGAPLVSPSPSHLPPTGQHSCHPSSHQARSTYSQGSRSLLPRVCPELTVQLCLRTPSESHERDRRPLFNEISSELEIDSSFLKLFYVRDTDGDPCGYGAPNCKNLFRVINLMVILTHEHSHVFSFLHTVKTFS